MTEARELHQGACHCGAVRFEVNIADGFATARRCSCSYCAMRGAVAVSAKLADLVLLQGEEQLSTYRFNTGDAEHHFCSICGIYTHHRRRSNPEEYGVNAACLYGVSPFDFRRCRCSTGSAIHRIRRPAGPLGSPAP
jgi:hypothetical protein